MSRRRFQQIGQQLGSTPAVRIGLAVVLGVALLAIPIIRGLSSRRAAVPEVPPAPVARVETPTVPAPAPQAETAPPAETPPAPASGLEATASAIKNLAPLHFAFASTSLTPQSMENLNQVATILQANPEASIRIVSHTDNTGTPEGNQALSEARSEAVKTMLVERNIDATRIEAIGAGQDEPIASNDTAAGRAENRRTDIRVTDS